MKHNLNIILNDIYNCLNTKSLENENIGILDGISGIMIFDIFYEKYFLNKDDFSKIQKKLDIIIEKINSKHYINTYCSGLAGFGWTICYLKKKKIIDLEDDFEEFLNLIDEILYREMIKDFNEKKFDYLHGGLGYSNYFLIRYQIEKNKIKKDKYFNYLRETISFLSDISIKDNKNFKWPLPQTKYDKHDIFNFGLAHGIPSIIYFLSKLYENNIERKKVKILLNGGLKYLLSNTISDGLSIFPSGIINHSDYNLNDDHSRLAWCYGDLGVAFSILIASKALKSEKYRRKAREIFTHSCSRLDLIENKLFDAPLCHGIFGLVLMYNKINIEFEDNIFKEKSDYWKVQALALYDKEDKGLENLTEINLSTNVKTLKYGILEGLSGIGLCILSEYYDLDTDWDSCLMLT